MFLLALDHIAQNSQQWVTLKLGLNSTRVKGFLARQMYLRQQDQLRQVPNQTNNLQPVIPHMVVPSQEMCPLSTQYSFGYPSSLPGIQQHARHEVS